MTIIRDALLAIEEAAVRSWPALETANIDGWLWRFASGGSLRANSVATLHFRPNADVEAAIDQAERRYRANGTPSRFTISDISEPHALDQRLEARGYARGEDHITMVKDIAPSDPPSDVVLISNPTPAWFAVYLSGISDDRRGIAPRLLAGLPPHRSFFAWRHAGSIAGSGLSVADGSLASVQCMATLASACRQGGARAVLRAIETWAASQGCTRLYLQAELANTPAISLYDHFGFRPAGSYHCRSKSFPS
jgi:GNAT superfamily N-acetyltransferase